MTNFRILIADDHELVRKGLLSLLQEHPGWEVCGEAADGLETVRKAEELLPDLIALDVAMPNLNGLEAARIVLQKNSKIKILFLTMYESEQVLREAIQVGGKGLILKSDAARDLVTAVEALQRNSTFFTSRALQSSIDLDLRPQPRAFMKETLTPRERQVVQLLAEGKSTKEAAAVLGVSVKTAETHRSNIMRKLHLHSAGELVLYAVRNNLIQI